MASTPTLKTGPIWKAKEEDVYKRQIQLWEALMAKQRYEMPPEEWRRLQPFYVLTVEALKNERDRAAKRGGAKKLSLIHI